MFPVGINWFGHVDSGTSLVTPQAEFILKQTQFFPYQRTLVIFYTSYKNFNSQ